MTSTTTHTGGRRHGDAGMTLTELLVVTSMLGMILVVVVGAITVIFRGERGVTAAVTESHDLQQTVNYFHRDVQSGPFDPAAYRGTAGAPAGTGCSDAGDENVFRYDAADRRIAYRLVDEGATARLDRYVCVLDGGSWREDEVVNLADALSVGDRAIEVVVDDVDADGEVEAVTMSFPQSTSTSEVSASPRTRTGVTAPSTSAACGDDPLAAALGFPGFVLGDVVLANGEIAGPLAVGGTLRWEDDIRLARNDKNGEYGQVALYAAAIDWTGSRRDQLEVDGGDVVLGGDYAYDARRGRVSEDWRGDSNRIDVKRDVVDLADVTSLGVAGPIDVTARFETLRACSNAIAELPDSCVDCAVSVVPLDDRCRGEYRGSGDLCLELSSDGVQVLTIPESVLDTVGSFDLDGPGLSRSRPLVVNVIDDGDGRIRLDADTGAWSRRGDAKFVLINFPNATEVDVRGELAGTILAPFAHVTTEDDVLGGVFAASWTHDGGTIENDDDNVFDSTIDWGR